MKKILIVGLYNTVGGIEKFYLEYLKLLDRTRIEFSLLNEYTEICFEKKFIEMGIKIEKVCSRRNPYSYFKEIKKLILKNQYDIVHINMLSCANIIPLLAAKSCNVKIITHSHNGDMPADYSLRSFIKRFLHIYNKYFVNKYSDVKLACSRKAGFFLYGKNKKFLIIKNAIDVDNYAFSEKKRALIRNEFSISDDIKIIGHVGRFEYQKNQEFLIEIFQKYVSINKNAILMLVGVGNNLEKCKILVRQLNIQDKVIFCGLRDDIPSLLSAFDIFVFPSRFEGLSIAGIEAICSGLPILASDTISEEMDIIKSVKWLSLKDSYTVWSTEINNLLNIKKDRKKSAFDIRDAGFDIKSNLKILESLYLQ